MKKAISSWQMVGFVFTGAVGTFLHFLFDWTGGNAVADLFSAVNESIWEHMKLLYWPVLLYSFVEYGAWGREQPGFWCVKLVGGLTGLLLIPGLFYTYTGAFGLMVDWLNIAIFFLAAGVVFWLETKLFKSRRPWNGCQAAFLLLCGIGIVFCVLTFYPIPIPLFQDPITGTYGFR